MEVKEIIERNKLKAKIFLDSNKKVFIKDLNGNYYFCIISEFDDESIIIINFTGNREGVPQKILWLDVVIFEEYHKKEEIENE